jgi:hypothetical protein
MKGDGNPFLGVPAGSVKVENPDGVFLAPNRHSLYDAALVQPQIPGDYDLCAEVGSASDD